MPARMYSSVLLPEPEGPISATNSPALTSSVTPLTASISTSPHLNVFLRLSAAIIGIVFDLRAMATLPSVSRRSPTAVAIDHLHRSAPTSALIGGHASSVCGSKGGKGGATQSIFGDLKSLRYSNRREAKAGLPRSRQRMKSRLPA